MSSYSSILIYRRPASNWRQMQTQDATKKLKKDLFYHCRRFYVARKNVLLSGSETIVLSQCADGGSFSLQPEEKLFNKHHAQMANGVADTHSSRPLRVIVANFARHKVMLCKGQVFGRAGLQRASDIYKLVPDQRTEDTELGNTAPHRPTNEQESQATQLV